MGDMATYYLGRVIKTGTLTADMIVNAILNPKAVEWRGSGWSFFDAMREESNRIEYVYARLSKFNPEGEVVIADPKRKQEIVQSEPNLRVASSTFVYIPSVSGIAFTRVCNHISERQFTNRFSQIIAARYDNFFVECEVKLISDLRTFADKLMSLDKIYAISANLNPPNPLFGPLWKPLKDYIKKRRAEKMLIREEVGGHEALNTDLPTHVTRAAEQTAEKPYEPAEQLPIGDAAILMAADGYGKGSVKGIQHSQKVVIKTTETVKTFDFDRTPEPSQLFERAYDIFKRIEQDRHMEH